MKGQKNSSNITKMVIALIIIFFCSGFINEVDFHFYIFQKAKAFFNVF